MAHNAITFDDGQGQVPDSMSASGRIVAFQHNDDWDYTVGDATPAYGGKLTEARRTVLFLRPDTAVIYDSLAADTEHRWEWRLHALEQMTPLGDSTVRVEYEDAMMCVDMAAGPPMRFVQTDAFNEAPLECLGEWPKQWHGTFETERASRRTGLLSVLRIGCHARQATEVLPKNGGGYTLKLGGQSISIDREGASVR